MSFTARQSICLDRAGFVWTARTGPLGLITVRDELQDEIAEGSVRLLGHIPLARAAPSLALVKADLMRYLAELPWAPDAILSNDQLRWTELGEGKLRVATRCANVEATVVFTLNTDGFVSRVEAHDRPRQEGSLLKERPWRGEFSDYREVDGHTIPHAAEVGWIIDGDHFSVWKGRLERWRVSQRKHTARKEARGMVTHP